MNKNVDELIEEINDQELEGEIVGGTKSIVIGKSKYTCFKPTPQSPCMSVM